MPSDIDLAPPGQRTLSPWRDSFIIGAGAEDAPWFNLLAAPPPTIGTAIDAVRFNDIAESAELTGGLAQACRRCGRAG
jgi:hypothetical protein